MEDELRGVFLPALFKGDTYQIPGIAVNGLPFNQAGISIPEPTQTAGANWMASYIITGYLVKVIHGTAEFRSEDHALLMGEVRDEIRRHHAEAAEAALGEARDTASTEYALQIIWITRMGAWFSVRPYTVNGMDLRAQEWKDYLFLHYNIDPPYLSDHYDECGAVFDICHNFECKKVCLITTRHNSIRDGVANLASNAFTPRMYVTTPKYT